MIRCIVMSAVLVFAAGTASAKPPADPVVTAASPAWIRLASGRYILPHWRQRPTAERFMHYYPDRASRTGVTGLAVMRCEVTAAGTLRNCAVIGESPADYGFGDAALKLSALFITDPAIAGGESLEGATAKVPIHFTLQ